MVARQSGYSEADVSGSDTNYDGELGDVGGTC